MDVGLKFVMTTQHKNNHISPQTELESVRNQIVNFVLILGTGLGVVLLTTVMLLMPYAASIEVFAIFIGLMFWWVLASIWRQRIPYKIRAMTIIISFYLAGAFNLAGWGLIGAGGVWFVVMVLLAVTLISRSMGILSYAMVVITYAVLTVLIQMNIITYNVDFEAYAVSEVAWFTRTLLIVLFCAMALAGIGRVFDVLRKQVQQFSYRSEELANRTVELSHEIERRQQAENSLETAVEHLKELDHLKDKFIDSVSHELRTPIANIQLYHQLLEMRPENKAQYLDILKQETARLSEIVEQMLYSSNTHTGIELSTMVDIDLKQVVNALLDRRKDHLVQRQITLIIPTTKSEYVIQTAPVHIERVVDNLVDNAVKYTPVKGKIVIEYLADTSSEKPMVGVMLRNTADPISEDDQDLIFERFVRGDASLKMGIPGAGLGLPIARQITKRYGGYLLCSYDAPSGMLAFTLWMPGEVIQPPIEEETKPTISEEAKSSK